MGSSSTGKLPAAALLAYAVFTLVFFVQPRLNSKVVVTDRYTLTQVDSSQNLLIETPTYRGVIFANTGKQVSDGPFDSGEATPFTATPEQILAAEDLLNKCAAGSNMDRSQPYIGPKELNPLPQYYRQYQGFKAKSGDIITHINCFNKVLHKEFSNWHKKYVSVVDGGNSFFHISINLTKQQCFHFFRNSEG